MPIYKDENTRSGRAARSLLATGVALAAAAALVQNRSRAAERRNPPFGRFVHVDGVRLHYLERGRGTPLVLLHGNVVSGLDFLLGELVEAAARRYRVIVFDRPGFGYSTRPGGRGKWGPRSQGRLIRAALSRIGVADPVVLGHSWGALVAMAMALDAPRSMRGLVLESGYFYPTARLDALLTAPAAIPVLGDLMRFTVSPLLMRANWPLVIRQMFAPAEVPEHFWEYPAWLACRPRQVRAIAEDAALLVPAAARFSRRYRELEVPTLILTGEGDRVLKAGAQSERLHRELPGSQLEVVPGHGHMLHHSDPGRVLAAIDRVAGSGRGFHA